MEKFISLMLLTLIGFFSGCKIDNTIQPEGGKQVVVTLLDSSLIEFNGKVINVEKIIGNITYGYGKINNNNYNELLIHRENGKWKHFNQFPYNHTIESGPVMNYPFDIVLKEDGNFVFCGGGEKTYFGGITEVYPFIFDPQTDKFKYFSNDSCGHLIRIEESNGKLFGLSSRGYYFEIINNVLVLLDKMYTPGLVISYAIGKIENEPVLNLVSYSDSTYSIATSKLFIRKNGKWVLEETYNLSGGTLNRNYLGWGIWTVNNTIFTFNGGISRRNGKFWESDTPNISPNFIGLYTDNLYTFGSGSYLMLFDKNSNEEKIKTIRKTESGWNLSGSSLADFQGFIVSEISDTKLKIFTYKGE